MSSFRVFRKTNIKVYRLCCKSGIFSELHQETDLTKSSASHFICVEEWRTKPRISLRAARKNPCNQQGCTCERLAIKRNVIDLADFKESKSEQKPNPVWIKYPLYTLCESDRQLVTFESKWLDDNIIRVSQLILAQQFPGIGGLQPITLEQTKGFQSHAGNFVQVLNVRNSHWVLVSNLGCQSNVVFVYDTMYQSLPSSTVDTIARLAFCQSSTLTIKMVDVDKQRINSAIRPTVVCSAWPLLLTC